MYLSKSKANSPFPLDKKKISREIILEHIHSDLQFIENKLYKYIFIELSF
jgi:hypothetical protein